MKIHLGVLGTTFRCSMLVAGALLASTPAQAAQAPQGTTQDESAPRVRYVRALAGGAKARNLADVTGVAVLDVPEGGLLAVYRERGDWLEVEAPGGFPVWIFGEFVKPASEAGMVEITGNGVRQRPTPSSSTENYDLRPTLARGARVRFLEQQDPAKPLAQDWIKIVSTPGTRAWVAKGEVAPLADGQDGAALWGKAVVEAAAKLPNAAVPVNAGASGAKAVDAAAAKTAAKSSPKDAKEALRRADKLLDQERAKLNTTQTPDVAAVRKAYEEALALAPDDAGIQSQVAARLKELDLVAQAADLKTQVRTEQQSYEAAKAEREKRMAEAQKSKDVYAGRFDSRGWVERRTVAGQPTVYLLRFGGEAVAEVVCNSGRYDLTAFLDYDIGVNGRELRPGDPTTIVPRPRVIDISRIEVLGARPSNGR